MLSPPSDAGTAPSSPPNAGGLVDRLAAHPLFQCSFRPLFLATAVYASLGVALWLAFLALGLPLPPVPGGPLAWHAHEMVFGFGLCATAGFVLTSVPEFTGTRPFGPRVALGMTALWLAGRIAFGLSGVLGPWPAAVLNVGLAALLPAMLASRLLRDPDRRHVGFLWGLAAFAAMVAGFHIATLRGVQPLPWAHAGIGVMMILVVVAMSRISMRILNDALDATRTAGDEDAPEYLARPPRRNLAIFAIALHTAADFLAPASPSTGWLALAAAAAILGLQNDWHVGRTLFGRWPALLYAVYWMVALGYTALGVAALGGSFGPGAGRHLLAIGGMGLSILAVLCIAGRVHCGRPLETRSWVPLCAASIVAAALLRAASGLPGAPAFALTILAGLAWIGAFGVYAWYMAPVLWSARIDGEVGCHETPAPTGVASQARSDAPRCG